MPKYNISVVSFNNTIPFRYGLEHIDLMSEHAFSFDVPAVCARKVMSGEADLGLVPVAAFYDIPDARIVSDFCIGGDGRVESVLLLSNDHLEDLSQVLVDERSMTTAILVKILARDRWKIRPKWTTADTTGTLTLSETTGVVSIGDAALEQRDNFKYAYDLSEAWHIMTGLPFVFACWVANKDIDDSFTQAFTEALQYGLDYLPDAVKHYIQDEDKARRVTEYLQHIEYRFNDDLRKGMDLFTSMQDELMTGNRVSG